MPRISRKRQISRKNKNKNNSRKKYRIRNKKNSRKNQRRRSIRKMRGGSKPWEITANNIFQKHGITPIGNNETSIYNKIKELNLHPFVAEQMVFDFKTGALQYPYLKKNIAPSELDNIKQKYKTMSPYHTNAIWNKLNSSKIYSESSGLEFPLKYPSNSRTIEKYGNNRAFTKWMNSLKPMSPTSADYSPTKLTEKSTWMPLYSKF